MTNTPWGKSDDTQKFAEGIVFHSTSSHGGFHLSKERRDQMPPELSNGTPWYEEDCEASLVIAAFPEVFPNADQEVVKQSIRDWFPEKFEAFYKEPILEGQSILRDKQLFHERNKNDYIVISAWDMSNAVGVLVLAKIGGRESNVDADEKYFIVPAEEYSQRGGEFVVDQEWHMEYPDEFEMEMYRPDDHTKPAFKIRTRSEFNSLSYKYDFKVNDTIYSHADPKGIEVAMEHFDDLDDLVREKYGEFEKPKFKLVMKGPKIPASETSIFPLNLKGSKEQKTLESPVKKIKMKM